MENLPIEYKINVFVIPYSKTHIISPAASGDNHRLSEFNGQSLPAWAVLGTNLCCLQFNAHCRKRSWLLVAAAGFIVHLENKSLQASGAKRDIFGHHSRFRVS